MPHPTILRRRPGLGLLGTTLAITLALAGVLVASGSSSGRAAGASSRPATATRTIRISPVTDHGVRKPGGRVTLRRARGTCLAGSEAVGGATYRCFSGNLVLDPCWAQRGGDHVLCAASPWRRVVARVGVRHLPAVQGVPRNVWGIRLVAGQRCTFQQGASGVVRGQRVNYFCGKRLYLYGEPDRSTPRWRIGAAVFRHGRFHVVRDVRIATAVLGKPSQ
jgi:hypothetical protein